MIYKQVKTQSVIPVLFFSIISLSRTDASRDRNISHSSGSSIVNIFSPGKLIVHGNIVEQKKLLFVGKEITGSGFISSPNIVIFVDVFDFTGTIDCSGDCLIVAKEGVNPNTFTFQGDGTLRITPETLE